MTTVLFHGPEPLDSLAKQRISAVPAKIAAEQQMTNGGWAYEVHADPRRDLALRLIGDAVGSQTFTGFKTLG